MRNAMYDIIPNYAKHYVSNSILPVVPFELTDSSKEFFENNLI